MLRTLSSISYLGVEPDPGAAPGIDAASFYGSFVQVIITLVVIIGIIVLLIRFLAKKNKMWSGDRSMRVLGGVTLGQHKSMQVVEIGGALYIVGVGENITLIDKVTDQEALETVLLSLEGGRPSGRSAVFPELFRWFSSRKTGKQEQAYGDDAHSAAAFKDLLQTKLKSVANRKEALREWMDGEDAQRRSKDTR
ncbi:flagellar biosynthetic protein FliO [Paenibacillus alkalitolerans]|uniref:flagellar biosynthetic protein FliO n=1 Tax=Paenibacillus alkalitolerans TaxID=2799335 RepID=UPI0018F4ECB9|nr:flagellar biosynthetic protein FliO [Paenibacillus alkalitolerans]